MISAAIKNRPDHQYNTLPPRVFSHHSCPCQIALGYRHRPESPTVPGCRWASRVSHTLLDWQPLGRALEPSITRAAALLRGGYSYPTKGRGGTVSVTGMGSFAVKGSDQRGGVPYPTKGRGGSFSTTSGTSGRLRGKRSARKQHGEQKRVICRRTAQRPDAGHQQHRAGNQPIEGNPEDRNQGKNHAAHEGHKRQPLTAKDHWRAGQLKVDICHRTHGVDYSTRPLESNHKERAIRCGALRPYPIS